MPDIPKNCPTESLHESESPECGLVDRLIAESIAFGLVPLDSALPVEFAAYDRVLLPIFVFRCRPQLVLKTCLRVLLTRRPNTADVSATSCDVGFFFLCRMSCRYLIADMSWIA